MTIDISNMTDDEFFEAYLTGTQREVISLVAAITRHENLHRFYSKEFMAAARRHAPAMAELAAQKNRPMPKAKPKKADTAKRLQKLNAKIAALEERTSQLRARVASLNETNQN